MEQKNMSKVLVTGGAGFIGSNLTEALLQREHLVHKYPQVSFLFLNAA